MSSRAGEQPLPLYGLAGSYSGERFIDGEGWDIRTVVHRPVDTQEKLMVGVDRRTTARRVRGGPRVAIPPELARESMATALAVSLPNVGNDVFEIAAEVACDEDAWRPRIIEVDGEPVSGYEREYKGLWIAYYLTPTLIVYVLAPVTLRPHQVKLRKLSPNEVACREDEDLVE